MRINGRDISSEIYTYLEKRVSELKAKNITPRLVVFLVGDDPSSVAYVGQKEKFTKKIGADIIVERYPSDVDNDMIAHKIEEYNTDPKTHGIIVQLPLPDQLDEHKLTRMVVPEKDIDGFVPGSHFNPPIAEAVEVILRDIHRIKQPDVDFLPWTAHFKFAIIGKGETGGKPIAEYFTKIGIPFTVIDSKTKNAHEILNQSDVIVSAVGKANVLKKDMIKEGAIIIGIGMYRGEDGKLHSDYNEDEIAEVAGYYTPVPGGVGPVNVAMLLSNLLKATENEVNNDYV